MSRVTEQAVVGAVLRDPSLYARAGLEADHFADMPCREIWRAFTNLHAAGTPIDPITLGAELERMGRGKAVGESRFTACVNACEDPENIGAYAAIVRQQSEDRRLREAISSALNSATSEPSILPMCTSE